MIYQIEMSKGPSIKIDEEDLVKIKANIGESLITVKQGIINPSFMISIIPTNEKEVDIRLILKENNGGMSVVGKTEVKTLANKMNTKNIKQLK